MRKLAFGTLAAMSALAFPAVAQAQQSGPEITIGVSAGLHDLEVDLREAELEQFDIDDSGEIIGGFAAADWSIGQNVFAGLEGNAHFGTGPIDAEYGASARLGFRTDSGTKLYLRGGYQWVDLDAGNLINDPAFDETAFDLDTTEGDYLVGAGLEVPIGGVSLRANVDTIAFDTLRGTVGLGLRF